MALYRNTKILIVDDYLIMLKITQKCLMTLGVNESNIYLAQSGARALGLLDKHKFDLVILDLNMPAMSGNQLLKTIRSTSNFSHLLVLVITGEYDKANIQETLSNGANSLLIKPFTREKLSQHITIAFASQQCN